MVVVRSMSVTRGGPVSRVRVRRVVVMVACHVSNTNCAIAQISNWASYDRDVHERPIHEVPSDEHAEVAAGTFRMLADPTRVKILWALLRGERSVSALAEAVDASAQAVSQHLAKLRLAGLVGSRREGTFIFYSAEDPHIQRLLAEALSDAEHRTGAVSGTDGHSYRASAGDHHARGPGPVR